MVLHCTDSYGYFNFKGPLTRFEDCKLTSNVHKSGSGQSCSESMKWLHGMEKHKMFEQESVHPSSLESCAFSQSLSRPCIAWN